jgi:hypothetical protein
MSDRYKIDPEDDGNKFIEDIRILESGNKEKEKRSCGDKITSLVCCHPCGSTCCMRGTKSRRCAKKFFKMMAVG